MRETGDRSPLGATAANLGQAAAHQDEATSRTQSCGEIGMARGSGHSAGNLYKASNPMKHGQRGLDKRGVKEEHRGHALEVESLGLVA